MYEGGKDRTRCYSRAVASHGYRIRLGKGLIAAGPLVLDDFLLSREPVLNN